MATIDSAYRMTKNFYPHPESNQAKNVLKLSRKDRKLFVQVITGQNNLNYLNNKIFGLGELCHFCEEDDESFAPDST